MLLCGDWQLLQRISVRNSAIHRIMKQQQIKSGINHLKLLKIYANMINEQQ